VGVADREVLDALAAARREQAMLMIHAENSDCITWLTEPCRRLVSPATTFQCVASGSDT